LSSRVANAVYEVRIIVSNVTAPTINSLATFVSERYVTIPKVIIIRQRAKVL
jgi:hypothetical protein